MCSLRNDLLSQKLKKRALELDFHPAVGVRSGQRGAAGRCWLPSFRLRSSLIRLQEMDHEHTSKLCTSGGVMGGSGRDSVRVLCFSTTHSASAVRLQFKSCRRFELANDCDWSHNFWVQNQVQIEHVLNLEPKRVRKFIGTRERSRS